MACVTAGPAPPLPPRLVLVCENIRTSPAAKSEEKRMLSRATLKHWYSPSEEGLESLRPRQVTPALGLIQVTAEVISGVGKGLWASDR